MAIIIDASVTMAWCFDDESQPYTESALDHVTAASAFVPAVWPLEIANGVLTGLRRGRISQVEAEYFLRLIEKLPIEQDIEALAAALTVILSLGQRHGLSAYDAAYLDLAIRTGLPLATLDRRLRDAALRADVVLFEASSPNGHEEGTATPRS